MGSPSDGWRRAGSRVSSSSSPPPPPDPSLESLLSAGDLQAAAERLRDRGDLLRARELFARIGAFGEAAAIARRQGDTLAELSWALRGQDSARVTTILDELGQASATVRSQAATICETAGALRQAAALRHSLGEDAAAARLLSRAGDDLGIARLAEARGEWRIALPAYRRFLASRQGSIPAPTQRDELLQAQRSCARLLCRFGDVEAAVPYLQAARRLLLPARREDAAVLQAVEAELIDAFLLLDEPELALRLFGQHAAWCQDARAAGSPVAYARGRAQRREPPRAHTALPSSSAEAATDRPRPSPWPNDRPFDLPDEALFLRRYRLGPLLGTGSVGRVHLADDLFSGRQVALKLLSLAPSGSAAGSQLYARFCREATLLSRLRHPRLLRIEAFHAAAGALSLEYMAGGAASQLPRPLSLSSLRRLLLDVLDGLLAMHAAGVLHRDIKPHNIFLDELGGAKLGDFGIATLKDLGVTQTEGLLGTLAYMAPEQIRSRSLSVATDVYGLAVTAFELLTATLPFPGPDFITQHLDAPPPDARGRRADVPGDWATLLLRLLHKDPRQRLHSIERLRSEVAALSVEPLAPPAVHRAAAQAEVRATGASDATDERDRATARPPLDTGPPPAPAEPLICRTPHSEVFVTTDARLGRVVVIERFLPGLLQSEAGAAQLLWLRQMAAAAGPGLQRIFQIRLAPATPDAQTATPPAAEVCFEHVTEGNLVSPAEASPLERAGLRRLLSRLHQAGVVHGSVAHSLVREPTQICLLLQGRGPLSLPIAGPDSRLGAPGLTATPALAEQDLAAVD